MDKLRIIGKNIFKTVLFCVGFLLLLGLATEPLSIGDYAISSRERGLKLEKDHPLDAVYIGASDVFSFFEPPLAWKDHGIAVYSYSIPSMTVWSVKYRIIEARKTQPDALYIISLNRFKSTEMFDTTIHRSVDYMPWSENKLEMMEKYMQEGNISLEESLEYYFPIIRFHSRWSELQTNDFVHPVDGYKGAYRQLSFLTKSADMRKTVYTSEGNAELNDKQSEALEDLLSYIEQEKVRVLFVRTPQDLEKDVSDMLNTLSDILTERGYDVLDTTRDMEEIGIQGDTDFHDEDHYNIHGAIKYTEYLSNYLVDHYGFSDKRGQAGWESWDATIQKYTYVTAPYVLDFELEHARRDYSLSVPKELNVSALDSTSALISWESVKDAEAFLIYRKGEFSAERGWKFLAQLPAGQTEFTDPGLESGRSYSYTVVPVRFEGSEKIYGKFSASGVKVTLPKEQ